MTFVWALLMVMFISCEKEQIEEPGSIAGMGEADGDLAVTPYELPEDFELIGEFEGVSTDGTDDANGITINKNELKSWRPGKLYPNYGNGGQWIRMRISISNNQAVRRTVFFPRGLVFRAREQGYQHGILLQWTWAVIPPQSTRTIFLNLFCINKGRDGSSNGVQYSMEGITKSKVMWKLLNRIGWAKINCEHYFSAWQNKSATSLKAEEPDIIEYYDGIAIMLQESVWALSNGDGLTA